MGCSGCGMFGMWDVRDVRFGDVECSDFRNTHLTNLTLI